MLLRRVLEGILTAADRSLSEDDVRDFNEVICLPVQLPI